MAAKNAALILVSVLLSLGIGAAGGYFLLPYAFPNVNKAQTGVIQAKSVQISDNAKLLHTDTTWSMINNTQVNITTRGGSSLFAEFNAVFEMYYVLAPSLNPGDNWSAHLALKVDGVGNNTVFLKYVNVNSVAFAKSEMISFTMQYTTKTLATGTYHVAMYWVSDYSMPGFCEIIACAHPSLVLNRTLTVEEIA